MKFIDRHPDFRRNHGQRNLRQITTKLSNTKPIAHEWTAIKNEAAARLKKELSSVRAVGDFSINDAIPCDCDDRKNLTAFLRNQKKTEILWLLAKERRRHIHGMIDGMGFGVSHETQRTGSPHKLVLKKLQKHFEKEAAHRKVAADYLKLIQKDLT